MLHLPQVILILLIFLLVSLSPILNSQVMSKLSAPYIPKSNSITSNTSKIYRHKFQTDVCDPVREVFCKNC